MRVNQAYLPLQSRLVGMRLLHGLDHRSAEVDADEVSATTTTTTKFWYEGVRAPSNRDG